MTPLQEIAKAYRREAMRLSQENQGRHNGGTLSCVDILTVLYESVMGPEDVFVLSKGHAAFALYAVLRAHGKRPALAMHPERDAANGVTITAGSLGHGLPIAIGMAIGKRLKGNQGTVYVLLSEGEVQCGTFWESVLTGRMHYLGNLHVIVDCNRVQGSGWVNDILPINGAMGWNTNGWNEIHFGRLAIEDLAVHLARQDDRPRITFVETLKGEGVSFMEGKPEWSSRRFSDAEYAQAMKELQ